MRAWYGEVGNKERTTPSAWAGHWEEPVECLWNREDAEIWADRETCPGVDPQNEAASG